MRKPYENIWVIEYELEFGSRWYHYYPLHSGVAAHRYVLSTKHDEEVAALKKEIEDLKQSKGCIW